jgi:hypothetical protein
MPPRIPLDDLHLPDADPRIRELAEHLLGGKEEYAAWEASAHFALFETTGNGLDALRAFRLCHAAGIYPDRKFLAWLDDCFNQWWDAMGKKSLEAIMGIRAGKDLKRNPLRTELLTMRDTIIIEEMAKLHAKPVKSIADAAYMVCQRMKRDQWDGTGFNLDVPGPETICNQYASKEWSGRRSEAEAFFKKAIKSYTSAEISIYLSKFPRESIPFRTKEIYL